MTLFQILRLLDNRVFRLFFFVSLLGAIDPQKEWCTMESVNWVSPSECVALPQANIGRPELVAEPTADPTKGKVERLIAHLSTGYSVATGAAMLVHLFADCVGRLTGAAGEVVDTSMDAVKRHRNRMLDYLVSNQDSWGGQYSGIADTYRAMYQHKGQWIEPKYLVVSGNWRTYCLPYAIHRWALDEGKPIDAYKIAIVEKSFQNSDTTAILQMRENARDDTSDYTDIGHVHLGLRLLRHDSEISEQDMARAIGIAKRGKQQKVYYLSRFALAHGGIAIVNRFAMPPKEEGKGSLKKEVYVSGGHIPIRPFTWQIAKTLLGEGKEKGVDAGTSLAPKEVPFAMGKIQPIADCEKVFRYLVEGFPIVRETEEIGGNTLKVLCESFNSYPELREPILNVLSAIRAGDKKYFADILSVAPPAVETPSDGKTRKAKGKGKAK